MSHDLLPDCVDTSLANYSCITDAVSSEVHDQWASRERRDALSLCGSWASCHRTLRDGFSHHYGFVRTIRSKMVQPAWSLFGILPVMIVVMLVMLNGDITVSDVTLNYVPAVWLSWAVKHVCTSCCV